MLGVYMNYNNYNEENLKRMSDELEGKYMSTVMKDIDMLVADFIELSESGNEYYFSTFQKEVIAYIEKNFNLNRKENPLEVSLFQGVIIDTVTDIFEKKMLREECTETIIKDIEILARKFHQLVTKDDYGEYDYSSFEKEMEYYIKNKFNYDINSNPKVVHIIKTIILEALESFDTQSHIETMEFDEYMSPNDYEYFCADLLRSQGLDARVTQQSGDQGVDIIVYYENEPWIAIQCKMYNSPVGNKAVQEIYTAKEHIGADIAIVVTNNTYTKSARQLANTTNTLLLHHDDLRNFRGLFEE
jgi:HJR/Mrr/RecB family endonuclease